VDACSESDAGQAVAGNGVVSASDIETAGLNGSDGVAGIAVSGNGPIPAGSTAGTGNPIPNTGGKGGTITGGGSDVVTSGVGGLETGVTDGPENIDTGGTGGIVSTGGTDGITPSIRADGYESHAPPLGDPIPRTEAGKWNYLEVEGAKSRDGSPAGFYYKFSDTSKNLMIFLMGGGACYEGFSCGCNPVNKDFSLTADMVITGITAVLGADPVPQDPNTLPATQGAIFGSDPANPVGDWNMVFVPYVTGDVYGGSRENATVPNVPGNQQFVGRTNMIKFMSRILPTFLDAKKVLLTGTSAGGIGSMLNASMVIDGWIDHSTVGTRGFIVNDSGGVFDDQYLEPCLQQLWRDLWNLDEILPKDCEGCFNADGGGLISGLSDYLMKRYPDLTLGGMVDSADDQAMSMFLCYGLHDCSPDNWLPLTLLEYPLDRYRNGLTDFINNRVDKSRFGSYIYEDLVHQNFIVTVSGDRFYADNGTGMTIAAWLTKILNGETVHTGLLAN